MQARFSILPVIFYTLASSVILGTAPVHGQTRRPPLRKSPAPRPAPAKPAPRSPARPPAAPPVRLPAVTAANLGSILTSLNYKPVPNTPYQRLHVEEENYGYFIDLGVSKSGDWLVCMAHLAPIPDLTQVPPAPLLSLLSTNDSLLGMSFSYDRVNARIMLNATVPNRGLDPACIRSVIEGLKSTVRKTEGLWDPASW
jgi:hypothetical protein